MSLKGGSIVYFIENIMCNKYFAHYTVIDFRLIDPRK